MRYSVSSGVSWVLQGITGAAAADKSGLGHTLPVKEAERLSSGCCWTGGKAHDAGVIPGPARRLMAWASSTAVGEGRTGAAFTSLHLNNPQYYAGTGRRRRKTFNGVGGVGRNGTFLCVAPMR